MPIETPQAPRLSIDALHAVLPALIGSAGIRQRAPSFAASILASPRSLSKPSLSYPVYVIGLDEIVAGASLGKARLAAWRHEFASGDEVVAAEVSAERRPRFVGLNVSSNFRSVLHELRAATGQAQIFADQSFNPRLLQISALGIRALWLKASSNPASKSRARPEVVVPLAPTRYDLVAGRHYTPAEFMAALKAAAEVVLRADAPGKGA